MNGQLIQTLFADDMQEAFDLDLLKSDRAFPYLEESPQELLARVYAYTDKIYATYSNQNIAKMLKKLACTYTVVKNDGTTSSAYKRAMISITKKEKKILIYQDSIDEISQLTKQFLPMITREQIEQLHAAHEFFHLLEYENGADVSKVVQPVLRSSWLMKRKRMEMLSEIACYRFSMKFAKVDVHPRAFDYAALLARKQDSEQYVKTIFSL
ncbi:hypothetical protein [Listeria costaricensis]|uniref:hypothetical protein n=1 Tax=Listeria costaricensis TaxID=2026604 RepID=UPI000C06AC49|nr:hypothetical protein [Listeria costaricensis]